MAACIANEFSDDSTPKV